ncbi:MAG: Eco57I restriction-modification methylase domain-containing protein [Oscillospiraceae bacterium]|nr:Eco57I restriction-modification methylase domain-containing protein [Oscillospiraceae bacterium]
MQAYDVSKMMRQIKKITVDKAVKSGFDDESIYNEGVGIVMDESDVKIFQKLADVVSGQSKAKTQTKVIINNQGLTNEEYNQAEKASNKPKRQRTPEEEEALRRLKEAKKEQEKVIRLLRAVSIRLPMLIYGADVELDENIGMAYFIERVDDESWKEFMPDGVSKDLFRQLLKYYDEDVVVGAGLRIRHLAKAADELPPTRRVQRIAEIFATFRNPDKETVLTPWRVVNMHMGDCIGGYNFYKEGYPQGSDGLLETPRLIDNGEVTEDIFLNLEVRILEMNSKSGLYPLYLTYSLYAMKLSKPESQVSLEEAQKLWQETLEENIYVLCKTKMAVSITRRTLAGYQDNWQVNAVCLPHLIDDMQDKPDRITKKLTNPNTWQKEGDRMKFDAIVGNPLYAVEAAGAGRQATPVYNLFIEQAKDMNPKYISMITPSRWFSGGMGLDDFRSNMMEDRHLAKIYDFTNSKDCFVGISISGGVCYFLWDRDSDGDCQFTNITNNEMDVATRPLNEFKTLVRYNKAVSIIRKVQARNEQLLSDIVSPLMPFGLSTSYRGRATKSETDSLSLYASDGVSYISESEINKGQELIYAYKIIVSKTSAEHAGEPSKDGNFKVIPSSMKVMVPGEVCTHSYFLIGNWNDAETAENALTYLKTKFATFLAPMPEAKPPKTATSTF